MVDFNRANRKALALLALVFVLGVALGAVGHMLSERNVLASRGRGPGPGGPGPGAQGGQAAQQTRLVGRLKDDLNLTDEQQMQIKGILADTQHRYDDIREQMSPLFDKARNDSRDHMRAVLTPEQRPKFEDFLRRVDEERQKRDEAGTPPGRRSQ
jgi:Spy/CpxP family protein refolding chaperone